MLSQVGEQFNQKQTKMKKQIVKMVIEIVKRLVSKGEFKSPKLFKGIQITGIISLITGLIKQLSSPKAEEVADQVLNGTEVAITSVEQLINLVKQVNGVSDPVNAYLLIGIGIVTIILGRLPKVGKGQSGDPIPPVKPIK